MDVQDSTSSTASLKDEIFESNFLEQCDEIVALESIYNSGENEKIKVLTQAKKDKNQLFNLLITVCPLPIADEIQVEVVLPLDPDVNDMAAAAPVDLSSLKLPANVQLLKSLSGQKFLCSFSVKYLSPLYLLVTFPASYPSKDAPHFDLQCPWLSKTQIDCIGQVLEMLWAEGSQMPIIYTWVNWLENNLISHLEIQDLLVIQPELDGHKNEKLMSSLTDVVPWYEDIGEVIATMKRYNQQQMDIEFCQSTHECHVCYQEKLGHQFFRMHECPHTFCHECMAEFCELHVKDGTVEALRCPDRECSAIVPPYIVQAVLGQDDYMRWEQLLLQKTLDAMSDTVYCPRCNSLVIAEAEEELHLAHCTACYFSFCTLCNHGWHQGRECQTDEELLNNMDQHKNVDGLNPAQFAKYRELRRKLQEEIEAKNLIKNKTQDCPHCRAKVEKIGGCNKMTCRCGKSFCWLCKKKIEDYSHFQKGCQLFPGVEAVAPVAPVRRPPDAVLRIQAQLEVNPELGVNRTYCPTCKQINLKGADHNNHIKCWNCKSNFCFSCKSRITGSIGAHFAGPCVQHT
nr:E3 ubiquitin-protein ligase RNF14 [Biomphalaria glabrata]